MVSVPIFVSGLIRGSVYPYPQPDFTKMFKKINGIVCYPEKFSPPRTKKRGMGVIFIGICGPNFIQIL
jgi:hypothetical protein